jgi:hypothetical protein
MAGVTRAVPTGVELDAVVLRAIAATLSDALTAPAGASTTPSVAEAGPEPGLALALVCSRRIALSPLVLPSRTAPGPAFGDARAREARSGVVVCAP